MDRRALAVLRARGLRRRVHRRERRHGRRRAPPGEAGWPIEIADPDRRGVGEGRTVAGTRLRDAALATAANTESIVRYGSLVAAT